jgi:hypothetical protein
MSQLPPGRQTKQDLTATTHVFLFRLEKVPVDNDLSLGDTQQEKTKMPNKIK